MNEEEFGIVVIPAQAGIHMACRDEKFCAAHSRLHRGRGVEVRDNVVNDETGMGRSSAFIVHRTTVSFVVIVSSPACTTTI